MPYLYSPTEFGGHFVSYEDEESLAHKLAYLQNLGLGGVMYWEITADRDETLVDLIAESVMVE